MFDKLRRSYSSGGGSGAGEGGSNAEGTKMNSASRNLPQQNHASSPQGFVASAASGVSKVAGGWIQRVVGGGGGARDRSSSTHEASGSSLFSYFREGASNDNDTAPNSSNNGSNGGYRTNHRPPGTITARSAATPDSSVQQGESYVELHLEEPLDLEFEHVLGRIVLKSGEEGSKAMKGVPPGSVLIGVDGELLNVDNFSKVFAKVTAWTNVPEQQQQQQSSAASINDKEENDDEEEEEEEDDDAQHPSPESEREEGVVKNVDNDDDSSLSDEVKQAQEDSNGPVDVSSTVPTISQESEKEDDAPEATTPTTQTSGQAVAAADETPTSKKKKKKKRGKGSGGGGGREGLRLTFRLQAKQAPLMEVQEIFPLGLGDGFRVSNKAQQEAEEEIEAHVVFINDLKEQVGDPNLPDRLAEHFLVMCDMDVINAKVQYEAVREEARELMNEIDSEVDLADDCPVEGVNLVWDPAEEGPNVEEFPLFEAETLGDSSSPSGDDIAMTPRSSRPTEYDVVVTEPQKLGITVENVLERTIICTVSRTSCAFRAGMEEGCLITALADLSTRSMCHKEVIDRLQIMHRPLRIKLRRLAPEKLQQRRAEMIALMHPHGMVATGDTSLESRTQTVEWAEQKMLSLIRLLAVGSLLRVVEGGGGKGDQPELWRERVLDIAATIQQDLKRSRIRQVGLNERLKNLGRQLQSLVELFSDLSWSQPALTPIRWHFIDMVCQALCVDADCSLTTTRGMSDLSEGPAIILLTELVSRLKVSQIQNNINMLLYRLAGSYSLHARVACCAVAPAVYSRMPMSQQLQVRGILMRFSIEEVPTIRSVVVETLSDLAGTMDYHSIKWLFWMLEASAKDGSPRVRNKILEICYRIARSLHRATVAYPHNTVVLQELHLNRCKLLPFVNCSADDPDWQVRAAFAFFSPGFVDCFGEHWATVFIDNLEALMRDPEVQVRRLAVDSIPKIAAGWLQEVRPLTDTLSPADGHSNTNSDGGDKNDARNSKDFRAISAKKEKILDVLLPGFMRLVSDPSMEVRTSVAAATGKILRLLSRSNDEAYDEALDAKLVQTMTPLMQRILHDEAPAHVSLALLNGMRMDEQILAGDSSRQAPLPLVDLQVELLLPAITFLATNPSWRLRCAVVESLPALQVMVLPGHRFEVSMQDLWDSLLKDGVEIVRRRAGEYLCLTGRLMMANEVASASQGEGGRGEGSKAAAATSWVESKVLPSCRECLMSSNFKQRQLGLHMAEVLIFKECLSEDMLEQELLPMLLASTGDRLANVRLVAAAIWEKAGPYLPERLRSNSSLLISQLTLLCCDDPDRDVRYFAQRSLSKLGFDPPPQREPAFSSPLGGVMGAAVDDPIYGPGGKEEEGEAVDMVPGPPAEEDALMTNGAPEAVGK